MSQSFRNEKIKSKYKAKFIEDLLADDKECYRLKTD